VIVTGVYKLYGKRRALIFGRDITQRKQLEKSKLEIEAQLRQQQKLEAIGTLPVVAHEINNP
jgi:phosphoglycerate-specific signal transduction histidine kinase